MLELELWQQLLVPEYTVRLKYVDPDEDMIPYLKLTESGLVAGVWIEDQEVLSVLISHLYL